MKAIQTRYLGATNYRGSRIKASADGWGSVIIGYPHEYNTELAHYAAAKALIDKANKVFKNSPERALQYPTISGGLPNGDWCFCYAASTVETAGRIA
jgi:glutamate mutase epsilon subunit